MRDIQCKCRVNNTIFEKHFAHAVVLTQLRVFGQWTYHKHLTFLWVKFVGKSILFVANKKYSEETGCYIGTIHVKDQELYGKSIRFSILFKET